MAVTHNPAGFTGTVDQVDEARRFAVGGGGRFRVNSSTDWAVTADGATARTVNIAAGMAAACGVVDITTATESLTFAANVGGSDRFDAVVATFDWTGLTITFQVIQGTTVPPVVVRTGSVVDGTKINWLPGLRYDAVLAIIRVRPSVSLLAPADLYDSRPWGSWSRLSVTTATYRDFIDADINATMRESSTGTSYWWNGTAWGLASTAYADGTGTSLTLTTTPTAPSGVATLTSLPAGTYDVDIHAYFALSVSTAGRQINLHLYSGSTSVYTTSFAVPTASTTASRNHADFTRITLAAPATLTLRVSADGTGGTQAVSTNSIRAVPVR